MDFLNKILLVFFLTISLEAPVWGEDTWGSIGLERKSKILKTINHQVKRESIKNAAIAIVLTEMLVTPQGIINTWIKKCAYNKVTGPVTHHIYDAYYTLVHAPIHIKYHKNFSKILEMARFSVKLGALLSIATIASVSILMQTFYKRRPSKFIIFYPEGYAFPNPTFLYIIKSILRLESFGREQTSYPSFILSTPQ